MPGEISDHWLGVDGFFVLGLPFAILIALLVSRRRRDGWWRGMLRFGLATYLVFLIAQLFSNRPDRIPSTIAW